jgi:hypothetical protein
VGILSDLQAASQRKNIKRTRKATEAMARAATAPPLDPMQNAEVRHAMGQLGTDAYQRGYDAGYRAGFEAGRGDVRTVLR